MKGKKQNWSRSRRDLRDFGGLFVSCVAVSENREDSIGRRTYI